MSGACAPSRWWGGAGLYVLTSAAAALAGTLAYELLKETLVPAISRWESHLITIAYVTAAAGTIARVVYQRTHRLESEVAALQGWGERNEAALQAFVDAIPEPAFLVGRQHRILTCNDALARRLGTSPAELRARDPFAMLRAPDLARSRAARVDEVFARGVSMSFRDSRDGRHYVNHLGPVRNTDGSVFAVGVVAIDVTDLHTAQEDLARKEELLRLGLEASRLGVWEWDLGTDVVAVSPETIALFGGPSRPWRGSFPDFLQHVEPDDRERVGECLRAAAAGRTMNEPVTFRARPARRRTIHHVSVQGRLFKREGGHVCMVGTVADATARLESEARRRRAEQALKTVTQGTAGHTGHAFFPSLVEALARSLGARFVLAGRVSPDGASLESLAGWADGPAPDVTVPFPGTPDASACQRWLRLVDGGARAEQPPSDDGAAHEGVHTVSVPIVSAEGRTLGVVAALDDKPLADLDTAHLLLALSAVRAGAEIERLDKETQIMRLNADLEHRVVERTTELTAANRELEAFSYSVSHDLRAPLRSIDGFALALMEDHADKLDAEARQYVEIVRRESQRMGQLIDDLLSLARLGRSTLNRALVDVSALAEDIVAELRRREPQRTVEVTIEPGMTALADANLLRIALDNLIGNAWKFTGRRPDARISVGSVGLSGDPAHVFFHVTDNGAGFDSMHASKLFQPFARLHAASEYEGTGIGLATVARIIKRHGGSITAESRPGEGATFTWTMPRWAMDKQTPQL